MFEPEFQRRTDVLPGITGLWQVSGRSLLSTPDMLRLDIEYVDRYSIWLDIQILCKTPTDRHPRRRSPLMIRTVDPRNDPGLARRSCCRRAAASSARRRGSPRSRHVRLRDGSEPHARRRGGEPRVGFAFSEVDDFLGSRLLSLPFCDYLDPIVDTDEQWHELVDPLVARGLRFQIRVTDAQPPRDDPRFVQVDEMAWHRTDLEQSDEDAIFAVVVTAGPPERAHRAASTT